MHRGNAMTTPSDCFSQNMLDTFFPAERTEQFFDALYGSAEDGAYDIRLICRGVENKRLSFAFELHQRPGKCLACNLTYGLPQVFQRHPVIDVKGLVKKLAETAGWDPETVTWRIGRTEEESHKLHCVPLEITR